MTDTKTISLKEEFIIYNSQTKGHIVCRFTWRSNRVSQEARAARGKHGRVGKLE